MLARFLRFSTVKIETRALKSLDKEFGFIRRLKGALECRCDRGAKHNLHKRLTHCVELAHTPDKRFAHLKHEDGRLHQLSSDDDINKRLQVYIILFFHGVTVVENGGDEKDVYRELLPYGGIFLKHFPLTMKICELILKEINMLVFRRFNERLFLLNLLRSCYKSIIIP